MDNVNFNASVKDSVAYLAGRHIKVWQGQQSW